MFSTKIVLKVQKKAPVPPKAEAETRAWETKKTVLKGIHSHRKKKIHTKKIHMSPTLQWSKALRLQRQPNILRAPPEETSSNTMPSSSSPDYWVSPGEDKTTIHLCSLWKSRPISTRSNRLWRSSVTLMWPRSTPWSGLTERRRHMFTGSRLGCFGCCQQNWDHLNWVQLANSKYKNFIL